MQCHLKYVSMSAHFEECLCKYSIENPFIGVMSNLEIISSTMISNFLCSRRQHEISQQKDFVFRLYVSREVMQMIHLLFCHDKNEEKQRLSLQLYQN